MRLIVALVIAVLLVVSALILYISSRRMKHTPIPSEYNPKYERDYATYTLTPKERVK